jgi:hypothetical protein
LFISLSDGRVLILGGSKKPLGKSTEADNNPTFEFFPRENPQPEPFPFLKETYVNFARDLNNM